MSSLQVDVWVLKLKPGGTAEHDELCVLDPQERAKYEHFIDPSAARTFATARAALRRLLAWRHGCEPSRVVLATDKDGKPVAPGQPAPHFNVSHCEGAVIIALCDGAAVGVDIERVDAPLEFERMAPVLCSPRELVAISRSGDSLAVLRRLWCRKEAMHKAWGMGLAKPPSTTDLGDPIQQEGSLHSATRPSAYWLDLELPCELVGALALVANLEQAPKVNLTVLLR